jgi:hypothetical protein
MGRDFQLQRRRDELGLNAGDGNTGHRDVHTLADGGCDVVQRGHLGTAHHFDETLILCCGKAETQVENVANGPQVEAQRRSAIATCGGGHVHRVVGGAHHSGLRATA